MKCRKQAILLVSTMLFTIFIATNSFANTAIVNTETLNLRKEASTDSTILEQLDNGQKLDIIEKSGDWVKVKVKGITGFVHKDYIKIEENNNEQDENTTSEENQNVVENTTVVENAQVTENIITENVIDTEDDTTIKETNTSIVREITILNDTEVSILPLINASKITNVKKDTKATVMDEVKGWLYIQTEVVNGWIRSSAAQEKEEQSITTNSTNVEENNDETTENQKEEQPKEPEFKEKTMYVNYSSIYVRKGPGTENEVVETLILNSQVTVIGEAGDWYKVKVAGVEGYIAKRLLSNSETEVTSRSAEERQDIVENETTETTAEEVEQTTTQVSSIGQQIVDYAKQYLGCKYVYGGSGPSTFDCSGFTMYVYKKYGVNLSHSARAQSKNGTYVAKEDLQPGDLVFFKDYETMDGIGHCGIYIGEGNFIHASSGTGYCVKISTLLSGSYNTRYETARRLL